MGLEITFSYSSPPQSNYGAGVRKKILFGASEMHKSGPEKVQKPQFFYVLGTRNAQKNPRKVVKTCDFLAFFKIYEISWFFWNFIIFPEAGGGSCDFCNIGRRSAGFDEISYAGRRFGTLKMQTVLHFFHDIGLNTS